MEPEKPFYKPPGYSTVSPYLIVDGAAATIEFLIQVFGAVVLRRIWDDVGKLKHSEVRLDDTVLMIADRGEGWPAMSAHIHIYVENVDVVYARALDAGATAVQAPIQNGDEDKRGGVRDSGGTTWWIATKVE